MSDSHESRSATLRKFTLLGLAATLAFVFTLVFVRSPTENAARSEAPVSDSAVVRESVHAPVIVLDKGDVRPDPAAMQKAGPPDPVAVNAAEISAERAANAAAELAASAGTPGN
jgi:hypothetical protein